MRSTIFWRVADCMLLQKLKDTIWRLQREIVGELIPVKRQSRAGGEARFGG